MISVTCNGCGKTLQAPDGFAGKRAKCKQCGAAMVIGGDNGVIEDLVPAEVEEAVAVPATRIDEAVEAVPATQVDEAEDDGGRPRRRSRDDDFDDDDELRERPRRRKRRRSSGGGNGLKIAV